MNPQEAIIQIATALAAADFGNGEPFAPPDDLAKRARRIYEACLEETREHVRRRDRRPSW